MASTMSLLLLVLLATVTAVPGMNSSEDSSEIHDKKLKVLLFSDLMMSHMVPLLAVGEELASRGHNVTFFIPLFKDEQAAKMKAEIEKHGIAVWNVSTEDLVQFNKSAFAEDMSKATYKTVFQFSRETVSKIMRITARHLNASLGAGEWDIVLGSMIGPLALLNCMHSVHEVPLIHVAINIESGFDFYPSWSWPGIFSGAASDNPTFVERVSNIFHSAAGHKVFLKILLHFLMSASNEYCLSISVITHTLWTHFPIIMPTVMGFEYPRDTPPLVEYVGALIPKITAPLTKELLEWLENKPDRSVVYISMGSMFPLSKDLGETLFKGVMDANMSLLWALRKSNQWILKDLNFDPEKVLISDWTPQFSVLGSTAIHSAILHGGFNGLSEALLNGIPLIIVPQMSEQAYSGGRVHFNKLGILLEPDSISSSDVTENVRELDMGEYRSNVMRIQKAFHLAGGARRAGDLVEFYARVGYSHLVPAYVKYQWSWVVWYNIDVYAVLFVVVILSVLSVRSCCRSFCCWKRGCGRRSNISKIKKN